MPQNIQPDTSPPLQADTASYYSSRMAALGILPEYNTIDLWQGTKFDSPHGGKNILVPFPIFRETAKGIEILVYTIDRVKVKTTKQAQRSSHTVKVADKDYCITRLEHPIVRKDGSIQKYDKPGGEPSYPFFPPKLVARYAKALAWLEENPGKPLPDKLRITALYLTEGFFKAFKADMHGIDCVGVQSITTLRDKQTNQLWADIVKLVNTCKVERLVWLTDGDFQNITAKDLTEGVDLYTRPNQFYSSVYTFYEITSDLKEVQKYFGHINTDDLTIIPAGSEPGKLGPKGLDDLLCAYPEHIPAIKKEFNNFSIMAPGKAYPGTYITRINVTLGIGRVREYILKDDVTKFYLFHCERRPDIKNIRTFKFNGTTYKYNEEKGICEVEIPGVAADYLRAGNDYYKHIIVPDKNGNPVKTLAPRNKTTITDDHGKNFCHHIRKFDNFCIVPDHFNYQPIIHNCWNLYSPFTHEAEGGECHNTIEFFRHIFGTEPVVYTDKDTGITTSIPRYELGLDYITLAYKFPQQMLPILCLVSRERQTGKTKFTEYIQQLFQENAISIGNEDLEADFNAHWAGKLFIMVDETKVDNGKVINKIKRLSTAGDIILNSKGKDQVKLPFFAKFILTSNHVEDFIRIDKEEIRFWIQKVPPLKAINTKFLAILIDEIPAFLNFLNNRQMVSKDKERHWFDTALLQTEALNVVKANSVSGMEKKIYNHLQYLFEISNMERMRLPAKHLAAALKNAETDYVKKTLNDMGYKATNSGQYRYPIEEQSYDGEPGQQAEMRISIKIATGNTSFYEFERKDFTSMPVTDPLQPGNTMPAGNDKDLPF